MIGVKNHEQECKDGDMAGSFKAIRRAAKNDRQISAQTGTALVVRHGELIDRVTVTDQDAFPTCRKYFNGLLERVADVPGSAKELLLFNRGNLELFTAIQKKLTNTLRVYSRLPFARKPPRVH